MRKRTAQDMYLYSLDISGTTLELYRALDGTTFAEVTVKLLNGAKHTWCEDVKLCEIRL
jgi:hypothetical protein